MEEIWKEIEDYPGYQVSNLGRIRIYNKITYTAKHGKRIWKNRILKPKISQKDKCARVELWKNGKHKTFLVHRLIATTFLKIDDMDKLTVNHIDGNRFNNNLNNLEWLSRKDNITYGFENHQFDKCCKKCFLIKNNQRYEFRSLSKANEFLKRNRKYIQKRLARGVRTAIDINNIEYQVELA